MTQPLLNVLCAIVLLGLLSGCANYGLLDSQASFVSGSLEDSVTKINKYAEQNTKGNNVVIAHLEKGMIHRVAGDLQTSNEAFGVADKAIDLYDEQAAIQLSANIAAMLTNQTALPYRGKNYDRIMLSTYRALNFMEMGDFDSARVELNRARQRQRDAVARNAKRIEQIEAEAEKIAARNDYNFDQSVKDPGFRSRLREVYGDLDQYSAYELYVNPFCEWLQGVYFLHTGYDPSDIEQARFALKRTVGLMPDNPFLIEDLNHADRAASGASVQPITYVIFETGTAPRREEISINIPIFLVDDGELPYVGAAFPYLERNPNYIRYLDVNASGSSYRTSRLANIDAIVTQEFQQELPLIIARTLITTATKAIKSYVTNKAAQDEEEWVEVFVKIANIVYDAGTNEADLRTWATLPKEFQYARFDTPANGMIAIVSETGVPARVEVEPKKTNLVLIRSFNIDVPLKVSVVSF